MKTFNKEVQKIKNKRMIIAILVLIVTLITFILGIMELLPKDIDYVDFRKDYNIGKYAKTTIYYLRGPILEAKDTSDETMLDYYIAVGEDENQFVIILQHDNVEIPILGKSIQKEELDTLSGIEVYGKAELTSSSLKSLLNKRLTFENNSSFDEMLGAYHLNTIIKNENNAIRFLILALILGIIGILYILINKRIRKNVEQCIDKLKNEGKLDEIINEFDSGRLIEYKKLKVYLSPNYIFSYNMGLDIIAFKDIKEATISKKEIGNPDKNKYIIIITKENIEHYIAPMKSKRQKVIFNELLAKIKTYI